MLTTYSSNPVSKLHRGWLRIITRALLVVWVAFWAWFAIACGIGDGQAALPYVTRFVGALLGVGLIAWFHELAGALVLAGAGTFAFFYFPNPYAQALLALPALVLASLCLVSAWLERRRD